LSKYLKIPKEKEVMSINEVRIRQNSLKENPFSINYLK